MNIKKSAYLFVVFIISITLFAQAVSAKQTDEVRFSLTVWDQPLEDVLSEIEQITGFTIHLEGQIKSDPISGVYNNITVYDFFSIALDENNISVSTDPERQWITVSKVPAGRIAGQRKSGQDMDAFLESEAGYILKAKQSVKPPTDKEIEALHTDSQTGKSWHEIDQAILLSQKQKSVSRTFSEAEFLAAESDYILKAKRSVKPPTDKEIEALHIDSQRGRPWHEIDQAILLSQKQKRASRKFSEAEFLAAESDYIEHAKASNNTQNGSLD